MNILVDSLPETVDVDGEEYEIRTDFRYSILFELMMQDDSLDSKQQITKALNLYYPVIPRNTKEAVNAVLWFYKCGKEDSPQKKRVAARRGKTRVYSFDYDDDYIYAAFMTQYGLDLQDVEYLHWWKFRAMFHSLTSDNEFVKIMEYRGIEISDKMPKEQKEFYRKMKRVHALPVSKNEDERQEAIENALLNGGDLTGLV